MYKDFCKLNQLKPINQRRERRKRKNRIDLQWS